MENGINFFKKLENFKLSILSMKNSIANIKHPGNCYLVLLNINILSCFRFLFLFKETELDDTPQSHFLYLHPLEATISLNLASVIPVKNFNFIACACIKKECIDSTCILETLYQ